MAATSHAFGKVLIAAQLRIGFATAVDGRIDKIVENLAAVHPTFMAGPPRIFEKVRARVMTNAAHGVKAKIFGWAFGVGRKVSATAGRPGADGATQGPARAGRQAGVQQDQGPDGWQHPVLRLWLGRAEPRGPGVVPCRRAAGAGGLWPDRDQRVHLPEQPPHPCFGTVGPPLPGSEIKIAADGEIMVKGPSVMQGYHNEPEGVGSVVDGWFATGDIGDLDDHGYRGSPIARRT